MSEIFWIRIATNIFDDEKIKVIESLPDGDTVLIVWFKLLVLAGRCNDCGLVYLSRDIPYEPEKLSIIMRRPVNTIRLALSEFERLGMIQVDQHIGITNWEKHQNVEGLDKIREKARARQQKWRERQKLLPISDNNVMKHNDNALEKSRVEKNRKRERGNFVPPTMDDVRAYLNEIQEYRFTAKLFIDTYSARGWMIGKNKMKDWRAAVRTWRHREDKNKDAEERQLQNQYGDPS